VGWMPEKILGFWLLEVTVVLFLTDYFAGHHPHSGDPTAIKFDNFTFMAT
jgi:hypothetical protein